MHTQWHGQSLTETKETGTEHILARTGEMGFGEELTAAVGQMASGRAPGLDRMPADFYKSSWGCLGASPWELLQECTCHLTSCHLVLVMIRKKVDLALLKNWWPVALLCTDYKLLSKVLANRLKNFLDLVVYRNQSYCVLD